MDGPPKDARKKHYRIHIPSRESLLILCPAAPFSAPAYDGLTPMRQDLMDRQAQQQSLPPPTYDSLGTGEGFFAHETFSNSLSLFLPPLVLDSGSHDFGGPPGNAPPTYSSLDSSAQTYAAGSGSTVDPNATNPYIATPYSPPDATAYTPQDAPPVYQPSEYAQEKEAPIDFNKAAGGQAYGEAGSNPYGYNNSAQGNPSQMYPPQQQQQQSAYPPAPGSSQMYDQSPGAPYAGLAPPSQTAQYPGADKAGFVYNGAPPPQQQQQQQQSYPPQQYAQQPQQVNVIIHKDSYSPLSYGSSFTAQVRSFRHNRFVSIGSHFELGFSQHPTEWNFILSEAGDSYYIAGLWQGAPSPNLQLKVAPTPFFWRANRLRKWEVERSFGATTNHECEFLLENHGGQFAIRNKASGKFLCAESHCLRADRDSYKDWEKFSVQIVNVDQSLTLLTPFGPMTARNGIQCFDLVLTYHVAFRAKISSKKNYDAVIGLKHNKPDFTNNDSVWEFLPHPSRNAYFIRNADHPDLFWHVHGSDPCLKTSSARHDVESAFQIDFHHNRYYFKSVATQRYGTAESHKVVFNRDKAADWEAFSIVVLHQLD